MHYALHSLFTKQCHYGGEEESKGYDMFVMQCENLCYIRTLAQKVRMQYSYLIFPEAGMLGKRLAYQWSVIVHIRVVQC